MSLLLLSSVALGGAVGATARFAISHFTSLRGATLLPWGTLLANIIGCFLLGALHELSDLIPIGEHTRAMLSVGLIGALTTFSTFTLETINLVRNHEWMPAILNLLVSIVVGFAACVAGIFVIRVITRLGASG